MAYEMPAIADSFDLRAELGDTLFSVAKCADQVCEI